MIPSPVSTATFDDVAVDVRCVCGWVLYRLGHERSPEARGPVEIKCDHCQFLLWRRHYAEKVRKRDLLVLHYIDLFEGVVKPELTRVIVGAIPTSRAPDRGGRLIPREVLFRILDQGPRSGVHDHGKG